MAEAILLKDQIVEGYQLIDLLRTHGVDVSAAAWVLDDETERWSLYIVSKLVDGSGRKEAHARMREIRRELPDLYIDNFDIRLEATTHEVTKQLLEYCDSHPITSHGRYKLPSIRIKAKTAYIYPPATIAAPTGAATGT
jgi:hypothetical protein